MWFCPTFTKYCFRMNRKVLTGFLLLLSTLLYAQQPQDSVTKRILKQWNLSADLTDEVTIPFDTTFSLFNRFRLTDRYSPVNAGLGNYGLPFYQLNFFDRISHPDKYLYSAYLPLMYLPERSLFMNTQTPFTELVWTIGGSKEIAEQTFRVRHSQNVNRFLNFGLVYDIVYSLGQYSYQRSEDKNFTFFTSYTGDRYKLYLSAGLNNMTAFENGGIRFSEQLREFETREVEVNMGALNKASNFLRNNNLLIVQRYTPGRGKTQVNDSIPVPSGKAKALNGTFTHILKMEGNKRTYSDSYPLSGFYDTTFINTSSTFDSLSTRSFDNALRFDFLAGREGKFSLGGGAGIRNEIRRYSQIVPLPGSLSSDTAVWHKSSNVLLGKLYNNIGESFQWTARGELYISGYRAGDFDLNGVITKSFKLPRGTALWEVSGGVMNRQPSFWYERWGSNNFQWNRPLKKEFRIDAATKFSFPARGTLLRLNYAVIDNYTDFGSDALPAQHTGGLSVISLYVHKDFRVWKLHLDNDLLVQQSSNEDVLDLPLLTVRSAFYFEHLFLFRKTNGKLNTQFGADLTWHSLYSPYSYMPSTGRFYRGDGTREGNYPFLNVFLNVKLQRTRMFVMYDHVNSGFSGYNYFMVPDYPLNVRMFRFGIAWTFYD